jgi:hypothetical protein
VVAVTLFCLLQAESEREHMHVVAWVAGCRLNAGAGVSLVLNLTSHFYAVLCCAGAGHWTEDMRTDALVPAKLDNPNLKVRGC